MSHFEYEDASYWERTYSSDFGSSNAVTEGNDGEQEFDDKMLNAAIGKSVLDIGCGDGLFAIRMSEKGAVSVVGIDFSKVAISQARKNLPKIGLTKSNIRFELANANNLPFPNETFEIITCRRGPATDSMKSLSEAYRVLRKDGILMEITIGEHDKENIAQVFGRGQMLGSEKVSTLKEAMLREVGFKPLEIKNYVATEIFPELSNLIIRLKDSPIIPDFDEEKDRAYLEEVEKTCKTLRGIETQTHRVTIIAQK